MPLLWDDTITCDAELLLPGQPYRRAGDPAGRQAHHPFCKPGRQLLPPGLRVRFRWCWGGSAGHGLPALDGRRVVPEVNFGGLVFHDISERDRVTALAPLVRVLGAATLTGIRIRSRQEGCGNFEPSLRVTLAQLTLRHPIAARNPRCRQSAEVTELSFNLTGKT